MEEQALQGAKEIAKYLKWPVHKVYKKSTEMKKANVIIRETYCVRPGVMKRRIISFPSLLQRYLIEKYNKN